MADTSDELRRLEQARCAAISSGDLEALDRLLADDLTHTHINGKTDDKRSYLAGLRSRPRRTTRRDDLEIRVYDNVAVMTGTLSNSFPPGPGEEPHETEIQALQVWVSGPGGWRQVAFAASASV